jgi:predicted metal-dependent phosphotriesterase family hydrolase
MLFNTRKLIPYLKGIGVSDQQIHIMTVENPKRFFTKAAAHLKVEALKRDDEARV